MRRLLLLLGVMLAGAAAYVAAFATLLEKPMTLGVVTAYLDRKHQILVATPSPRILIFAGSNGRFSHSCAEITRVTGIACANLSINAEIGLKYQVDAYLDALRPGDVVYMPIEYRDAHAFDPGFAGIERSLLLAREPLRLLGFYNFRGVAGTIFGFDPRYLFSAIGEMALNRAGVHRRLGVETMNDRGDETANDAVRAQAYRSFVSGIGAPNTDGAAQRSPYYWQDVTEQVKRLRARGLIVIGGLATTFDEAHLSPATVDFLAGIYRHAGACFIALPNRSLYPRRMFFDDAFHLQDTGQKAHSRLLAPLLAEVVRTGRCR